MSLVGTRPPTVDEWDKYELHHRARLATKPGLTGMWQVSGRSNITDFEEVVKLDKQYISEWTMGLDIKILYKIYNHKLYKLLLTDPPESMRDDIFEIDGTKYLWMLFEELEVDLNTMQKNDDVIAFVKSKI